MEWLGIELGPLQWQACDQAPQPGLACVCTIFIPTIQKYTLIQSYISKLVSTVHLNFCA